MSWVQRHRRLVIFIALVAVQTAFILGIVVREEGRLDGLEIVLQSRPVDPRDLLRGDFVILGYAAEDVSGIPAPAVSVGVFVYVELLDSGRYWEPITVNLRLLPRDEWATGHAFLLARVDRTDPLQVSFPDLGEYFIPQGTGDPPEPPDVFVSVSDDGVGRIKRLEIDGVPWPNDTVTQDQPQPVPNAPTLEAGGTRPAVKPSPPRN